MPRKWIAITTILLLSLVFALPAWAQEEDETGPGLETESTEPTDDVSTETGDGTSLNNGFYCRTPASSHPVVQVIADLYENGDYQKVLALFCGMSASEGEQQEDVHRYGLGVIMLAYETAALLGNNTPVPPGTTTVTPSATDLLACKSELGGWGQVWKSLGFKGRSGKGTLVENWACGDTPPPPEGQSGTTEPTDRPGNGNGNAYGKNKANKPDKSNSPGKPDHAGPNK